ncbi:MAG: HAD-IIIA family hydrolase [Endomicrobium sp.]|jgi:histidinol-phosphate phosphatase family protein|nr:HAD-IIIA family hydrolase [Endomicrobium sp.]
MGAEIVKVPAVFLDRDGTVIFDRNYLSSPEQVKLYSFAAKSINKLRAAGFKIIVVTNQSGIGRGMFTEKDLQKVNEKFLSVLEAAGAKIDALYYCPHVDSDECCCRKPKTGMALRGAEEFNIDLEKSYAVGDSVRDYLLGFNINGKGILVLTGHGKKQRNELAKEKVKPVAVCKTLKQAANFIIKAAKKINILLMLFCLFVFVSESYCFGNGNFHTTKKGQSSPVYKKPEGKCERTNEKKRKYIWQKRGRYQLSEYEKLTYTILWNYVPLGCANLELRGFNRVGRRKAHHIYFYAEKKPFLDSFYNTYLSDIAKEQLGFDPTQQTCLLYDDGSTQEGNADEYVQDILTALYYIRTLDLKVGVECVLDGCYGYSMWFSAVKVLRKEAIETKLGKFNCFVVEPLMRKDADAADLISSRVTVWLTDDKRRIPVYMELGSPIGLLNVVLESADINKKK